MTRQEKRGLGDMRAMKRHQRIDEILVVKARKKKKAVSDEKFETDSLVIGVSPGGCIVTGAGEEPGASRLCHTKISVAPGDRVAIRHEKVAFVAPRRTTLSRSDPANPNRDRVIAANIDILVIVAAMADPPFRPGLVDRYLVAAARGGIQPILCVTKIDLHSDTSEAEAYRDAGVPLVRCSIKDGTGIEELRGLLAGSLAVFAGHSGVGKSSLLNAVAQEDRARTGAVSDGSGKGRHTTTSSKLHQLPNGARIIDTPGIREFGLGAVTPDELRGAFPEIAACGCKFRDCKHKEEPGCGVLAALESGEISQARYTSYLRIAADVRQSAS
jgi:ribosome biogenesis GTPase